VEKIEVEETGAALELREKSPGVRAGISSNQNRESKGAKVEGHRASNIIVLNTTTTQPDNKRGEKGFKVK